MSVEKSLERCQADPEPLGDLFTRCVVEEEPGRMILRVHAVLLTTAILMGFWQLGGEVKPAEAGALGQATWAFQPGPGNMADPVVDGDRLYVCFRAAAESSSPSVHLYGLQTVDGRVRWQTSVPLWGRFRSQGQLMIGLDIVAAGGNVYYVAKDEKLRALNGASGHERWSFAPIFSFLTAAGSDVYVLDHEQRLAVVDGSTGRVKQRLAFRGDESTRLVVAGDQLFLSGASLTVLDRHTGQTQWSCKPTAEEGQHAGVRITDDGIVLVEAGKAILGLDRSSGRKVWSLTTASVPQAVDQGRFYYTAQDQKLGRFVVHTADSRTGQVRAVLPIPGFRAAPYGALTAAAGRLYVPISRPHGLLAGFSGASDSRLCAVDGQTGQTRWCSAWQFEYLQVPVVAGRAVYVSANGEDGQASSVRAFLFP